MVCIFVFLLIFLKNHKIVLPSLKYKIKKYYLNKKNFYIKTLGASKLRYTIIVKTRI